MKAILKFYKMFLALNFLLPEDKYDYVQIYRFYATAVQIKFVCLKRNNF